MSAKRTDEISRREFLEETGAAAAAVAVATTLPGQVAAQTAPDAPAAVPRTTITVTVNGSRRRVEVDDRWTLAELLRDHLGLTGTKIGCDRGECGACTVLMNDTAVYACMQLAVWADGRRIDTVEGLARGNELHPLQQAFIEHNAPQCGFCTSGQLMAAAALLKTTPTPNADQVRSAMVGNLCRCSNYGAIVESVLAAASGNGGAQ